MSYGGENSNMYGLRGDQLFEIQSAFHEFDINHNGYITIGELRQCLRRNRIYSNDFEIVRVLSQMDLNGDGQVSYDEFMRFMAHVYRSRMT